MQIFYKIIYHSTFNKPLRNILKLLKNVISVLPELNPSGKIKIKVNPIIFYLQTNQTSHLTKVIFWNKPENFEYTQLFIKLIPKVSVFYDIGANIGYYSVLAAKINTSLKIQAFEPAVGTMIYLSQNVLINNLKDQVKVNPIAISNFSGTSILNEVVNPKYPYIYNLSGEHNLESKSNLKYKQIKVETTTIDDFVEHTGEKTLDLIKIDVEGVEPFVLEKAFNSIQKYKPIIICETLFNNNESNIESIMRSHNYDFYNHIGGDKLLKVQSIQRNEDNGVRNCFFVHPSKFYLIEEFVVTI